MSLMDNIILMFEPVVDFSFETSVEFSEIYKDYSQILNFSKVVNSNEKK